MVWFFVDGDDGYGSVDHMLRVKLMRKGIQLQIDSHSLDPNHPDRQNNSRPADKVSGAFRLNTKYPRVWISRKIVGTTSRFIFGEIVTITLDEKREENTEACVLIRRNEKFGGCRAVEKKEYSLTISM